MSKVSVPEGPAKGKAGVDGQSAKVFEKLLNVYTELNQESTVQRDNKATETTKAKPATKQRKKRFSWTDDLHRQVCVFCFVFSFFLLNSNQPVWTIKSKVYGSNI